MAGAHDSINRLPDKVLETILSLIPLKDAVTTSALASRWRNLWKRIHNLRFDARDWKFTVFTLETYVEMVNTVLQSHEAPELDQFKLWFKRSAIPQEQIDEWLRFAFAKRVQRLELVLKYSNDPIAFSESFRCVSGFNSLRSLSLENANVRGEAISWFLENCPFLESLAVKHSNLIVNLQVDSLILKHLEISSCSHLKSLKVSAPDLTSLKVTRLDGLFLDNVPKLIDVSVGPDWYSSWSDDMKNFSPLSCCISQLEVLSISSWTLNYDMAGTMLHELSNLKKLNLVLADCGDHYLLGLISLLRASPQLQQLVLELKCCSKPSWSQRRFRLAKLKPSRLRVMEFIGYCGRDSDIKTMEYLVKICTSLERMTVSVPKHSAHEVCGTVHQKVSRVGAKKQLQRIIPERVELILR